MFDYQVSKHPHFDEACRAFALRHNLVIHCLPCVPINEVAKEKLPHYVMSATAEIGRVAAGAVSGDVKTSAGRRDAIIARAGSRAITSPKRLVRFSR